MEKYYAVTFTSIQSNNFFCKVVQDFMWNILVQL